jgi:hypothetical protein
MWWTARRPGRATVAVSVAVLLAGAAVSGGSAFAQATGGRAVTAWAISTVAGGVGGPGQATTVPVEVADAPCGAVYGNGYLYLADGLTVRRVSQRTDGLTTPAGTGDSQPLGDLRPAKDAGLGSCGVALDHSGNLVIADKANSLIRVVAASTGAFYGQMMRAGDIYTVAGGGQALGDGVPATDAGLGQPQGVTADSAGNLVIADTGYDRIQVVAARSGTFYGREMIAGDIYIVAGNGDRAFSGDGGPAVRAALDHPTSVVLDSAGNLVITDSGNARVRVVAQSSATFYGQRMTAGNIYTVAGGGTAGGNGIPATQAYLSPLDTVVDGAGNLVIADTGSSRVRVAAGSTGSFYGQAMTAGDIYTIAGDGQIGPPGDGGPATSASLISPAGVAIDGAGNVVIADESAPEVRVVPVRTSRYYGQAMTAGHIYPIAGNLTDFAGDGISATRSTLLGQGGVAADSAGNLVIADEGYERVQVVAHSSGTFYGQAMTAGDIYTIAGDGQLGDSGDGGRATQATFHGPTAVALDHSGNVLVTDYFNCRVRVVAASTGTFYGQAMTAGDIYTIAGDGTGGFAGDGGPATQAKIDLPDGVAVDGTGNVVIGDLNNNRVRVVAARTGTFYGQAMTAGDIYTIAGDGTQGYSGDGGPGPAAALNLPRGVAVDAAGNALIADESNNRIRLVAARTGTFYGQAMTAGDIYTVAGTGQPGSAGDGGPAALAELDIPTGVAVDSTGNLLIADAVSNRIRVVAARSGTFYGQAMRAGDIHTVAGNGSPGFAGDGGPGTAAELSGPTGVSAYGIRDLLIADTQNLRVRLLAP